MLQQLSLVVRDILNQSWCHADTTCQSIHQFGPSYGCSCGKDPEVNVGVI